MFSRVFYFVEINHICTTVLYALNNANTCNCCYDIGEYPVFYRRRDFFFALSSDLHFPETGVSILVSFTGFARYSGYPECQSPLRLQHGTTVPKPLYIIMPSTWIHQRLPESPTRYIGFFFTVCLCRMRTIHPREPPILVHPSSRREACGCFASLVARS